MKTFSLKAAVTAVMLSAASFVSASPLPAVDASYVGNYDLGNAFSSHGLWLPGFLGDNTWSVQSGTANYDGTSLVMNGSVSNTVNGVTYEMDFDFQVFETSVRPAAPYCGSGQACEGATQEQKDNIVYFDMRGGSSMGTVTGKGALDGVILDIEMQPLDISGGNYKPGQLGYSGNWTTLDFGYSNWLNWTVTQNTTGLGAAEGTTKKGDINFDFLPNGNPPGQNPPPVPLPAGLPLLLAGIGAFAVMRRRAQG